MKIKKHFSHLIFINYSTQKSSSHFLNFVAHFLIFLFHYNFDFVKNIFLFCSFILVSIFANAQSYSIKGIVVDDKSQTLIGATVAVLNPMTKSIVTGTITDFNGNFKISNLSDNKILLKISYLGYTDEMKFFMAKDSVTMAGAIVLKPDATLLKDVKVVGQIVPTKQKGDTTEMNAGAFKTNPDATSEDLVNKMPGISSQNGSVTAHGETVKQVLVDGKPFFGDDPATTLKNLPADVIDKIQVFDKKTDQAAFSGFDDGNTSKTINVITKPQFRNGSFGKFYAGAGQDEDNSMRYKAGENFNIFKGQRRISILSQSNNTNEQNFAPEDLMGVMGGGGGRGMMMGGGNMGNFIVNQQSGITQTHAAGINYSDKWGKGTDVTASYFYNYGDNKNQTDLAHQSLSGTNSFFNLLNYKQTSSTENINQNHRFNFKIDSKIDSFNSILFQPKISVQQNDSRSFSSSKNIFSNKYIDSTNNTTPSKTGVNVSSNILWRHSFRKQFRTLSVNVTPGYNSQVGKTNYTNLKYDTSDITTSKLQEQIALNKKGYNTTTNLTYTEPIDTCQSLQFSYSNSFNINDSKRMIFNQTNATDTFKNLSNVFNSFYQSHAGGVGYNLRKKKLNLTANVNYQWAQLQNKQTFPSDYSFTKPFASVLPSFELRYKFDNEKNVRMNITTNNNIPSIDQLQNVYNTSNTLQVSVGNPNLKQDYSTNIRIRYFSVNQAKNTNFFMMLGGGFTQNYIGNSTTYVTANDSAKYNWGFKPSSGTTLTMPVNLDGYYNLRTFMVYGFPVKKLKMNFNINFSGNYNYTPSMINNQINYATNPSASLGIGLSSNISERFDYNISSNTSYNQSKYSLQSNLNQTYWAQTTRAKINLMPWKGLVITSDVAHQVYSGLSAAYDKNYVIWNAGIGYKFLKKKAGDLRLVMTDILNQNTSISRNITDTYIEDSRTTVLRRYVMLVFTYTFKNFGGKMPGSDGNHQHWMGGMPGGGFGPPGGRF